MVACVLLIASSALAAPVKLAFKLKDTPERVTGSVASWDFKSLELTPADGGAVRWFTWCDLESADCLRTFQKLIDRESPDQWLRTGLVLLACGHDRESDSAFAHAARLDKSLLSIIDTARAYQQQGRDPWQAMPAEEKPAAPGDPVKPEPSTPGKPAPDLSGAEKGLTPWTIATAEQREDETFKVRRSAETLMQRAGAKLKQYDSDHFMVFSDLPPADAKRCLEDLEQMNQVLVGAFELPKGTNVFYGKCAVFIFEHREEYLTFQTAAFGFDARRTAGVFQPRGTMAFCSFFRENPQSTSFRGTLVHETVHAFVYRYKSPASLPTWANEGFADLIASEVIRELDEGNRHWNHARQFANQKKRALDVMNQSYADGTWFNDDSYPISHMIVRLMIKTKPRQFKEWIDDIKLGIDWRKSMAERMNATPEQLSERFNAAILSEKRYTRVKE